MNEFRRTGLGKLAEDEPNVLEGLSFVTSDGVRGYYARISTNTW